MAARAGFGPPLGSTSRNALTGANGLGLPPRGGVRLRALVLIRWAAVAGQLFTVATVYWGLGFSLPILPVGGAIALINSMGALGSFAGTFGVGRLNDITGTPGASYLMMAAALIVSAAITALLPRPAKAL